MRIVAGKYKGLQVPLPKVGDIRPTTDRAKESLFNILIHKLDLPSLKVLDLFCGSGNMSIEFASRGCLSVTGVELSSQVVKQVQNLITQREIENVEIVKADVFRFIVKSTEKYDIIFADPPYALAYIKDLPENIFEANLLSPDGLLIIEHASQLSWNHPSWLESRNYGQSVFSFFSI